MFCSTLAAAEPAVAMPGMVVVMEVMADQHPLAASLVVVVAQQVMQAMAAVGVAIIPATQALVVVLAAAGLLMAAVFLAQAAAVLGSMGKALTAQVVYVVAAHLWVVEGVATALQVIRAVPRRATLELLLLMAACLAAVAEGRQKQRVVGSTPQFQALGATVLFACSGPDATVRSPPHPLGHAVSMAAWPSPILGHTHGWLLLE